MVLAVLEAHCGVKLSGHDVYLNVAGGLRIQEPAADLAAAAALVSSLVNAPLPTDAVYFGEISLSGAVRPVAQTAARLKEAAQTRLWPRRAARIGARGGEAGDRQPSAVWRACRRHRARTRLTQPRSPRADRRDRPSAPRQIGRRTRAGTTEKRRHLTTDDRRQNGWVGRDVTPPRRRYTTPRAGAGWRDSVPLRGVRYVTISPRAACRHTTDSTVSMIDLRADLTSRCR